MPVEPLSEPTPKFQYSLYEVINNEQKYIGGFDSLTGGEEEVHPVSYKIIDDKGNVTTRFMPGQTSFTPVSLLRAIDIGAKEIYAAFADSVSGKLKDLRKNYSVSMNDSQGEPLVWWDLLNTIPVKISGFDFNEYRGEYYTDFTIDLQPEEIMIRFI